MATAENNTTNRFTTELADVPAERLEADLIDLAGRLSAGTFELLVLVGELDARGLWARWGALSCAAWLAEVCDVEVGTARTQVRVARAAGVSWSCTTSYQGAPGTSVAWPIQDALRDCTD